MRRFIIIAFFYAFGDPLMAQSDAFPLAKWRIEPAIGIRFSAAFGLVDIQLSGLVQYQIKRNISLASHTAVSFDLNRFEAFKNIDPKYSVTTFQKFGVGASTYTKKTAHTLFFLYGGKYFTYSGSVKNPALEGGASTKFNTFAFDRGLMYNLKIGRDKHCFSGRIYAPVFDGKWVAIENAAIELGAGFRLK